MTAVESVFSLSESLDRGQAAEHHRNIPMNLEASQAGSCAEQVTPVGTFFLGLGGRYNSMKCQRAYQDVWLILLNKKVEICLITESPASHFGKMGFSVCPEMSIMTCAVIASRSMDDNIVGSCAVQRLMHGLSNSIARKSSGCKNLVVVQAIIP